MGKSILQLFLLFSVCVFIACTQNPVGQDQINAPNSIIEGRVSFDSPYENPENVLVWLEGFDLFTRTDVNGCFSFILPPPEVQASIKGVTGSFKVWYYMANFGLESSTVNTRNGYLINSPGSVNSTNETLTTKLLFQKLKIYTDVFPPSASKKNINVVNGRTNFLLRFDVTLQATKDSVIVFFPGLFNYKYGPLMFRNVKTNEVKVVTSTIAGFVSNPIDTITTEPKIRTMVVPIFPGDLGLGEFEIIPFLKVEGMEIPRGIRDELELESIVPGQDYIDIPFLYSGNNRTFTLTE